MRNVSIEFGTHIFCFECGAGWSEYGQPSYCLECNGVEGLATSQISLLECSFTGVMWEENSVRRISQVVRETTGSVEYCVPVPPNVFSLDLAVVDLRTSTVAIARHSHEETLVPLQDYIKERLA